MRVLQLVDSLRPGGGERMAVNLANALRERIEASYLCCTRSEGPLLEDIESGVNYIFLRKRSALDILSLWKLKQFVDKERIDIIHAHGTSWFFGFLLKSYGCNIKLIWHSHSGESATERNLNRLLLRWSAINFEGIICVNKSSFEQIKKELRPKRILQLNNFVVTNAKATGKYYLKGSPSCFKIICVANLRPQKDHFNLIAALEGINLPEISLHLIGADLKTSYSQRILDSIATSPREIYYYGGTAKISAYLNQADLGVLSSRTEGFPLVLLEYGRAGLPVVCTDVGECAEIVGNCGKVVPPNDSKSLEDAILFYATNEKTRKKDGEDLKYRIQSKFSEEAVIPKVVNFYQKIISSRG